VDADLDALLAACRPQVVYLHNPADKHDTHVAVFARALAALRRLPADRRPARVIGCEVWRGLDWLTGPARVEMALDGHAELSQALFQAFESQINGGKRYDQAIPGRWQSNAVFSDSHGTDEHQALALGMDLSPLMKDEALTVDAYLDGQLSAFKADVLQRLHRCGGGS
jgi:LmbE family N-acetylglucosaminyl deacetylase